MLQALIVFGGLLGGFLVRVTAHRITPKPLTIGRTLTAVDMGLIAVASAVACNFAPSVAAGICGVTVLGASQVAAHVDRAYRVIPNALTYRLPGVLAAITAASVSIDRNTSGLWLAVVLAVGAPLLLYSISLVYARFTGLHGFGMGDIKLVVSLTFGVALWGSDAAVVYAYATFVSAALVSSVLLVTGRASRTTRVAFAPYFVVGVATSVILLPVVAR